MVSIVFADLIGSTGLHERLDPESVSRLMDRYYRAVRAPIEAHGGTVVQLLGDGVMCAFGVPRVAEDDALRAVRAAVAMQSAFREFLRTEKAAGGIGLRVAINTGELVVSDQHAAIIGDPVNVAARLQQEAHDGDVLISESTKALVAERITLAAVGSVVLRGRAEPVSVYRVVSLEPPAGGPAIAFVGREDELRRINAVYETAVATPATRLAVVLGSPGLGKSRLIAEFADRLGDHATVLVARCDAAVGATFAPLADTLRVHLALDASSSPDAVHAALEAVVTGSEAERARVAHGIGALLVGRPASPEETFFVLRRLIAAMAAARPVVLAIDDLQWAEPLLLDLTEHLVQWGAGVPLLVLAAARPELRDTRSALTSLGGFVSDVLTLGGLDASAATRLAANVIGAHALPAAIAGRVLATSEGNPLFLGELVRMLVQDGALRREGDRWTAGVDTYTLEMPPTIQALLAARIERLRPEDRLILERASVVGRHFSRAAVAHLLPVEAHADLDARLESLRRSELIESDTGWLLGDPVLRFHHVLIRDAAYRRLLRNTRAELHCRLADWLQARVGDSIEHDETIGWHLEQAHQHLRELGPLDEHGRTLGERAARHLAAAGRRALARDDLLPAASLLGRALDRVDVADPTRADLTLDWCEALLAAGDVGRATAAVAELGRFVADSERLRAWHACFGGQLAVLTDPQALRANAEAVAAAAEALVAAGDATGEAKAHAVHALILAQLGKMGPCEAVLDNALAAARRARDRRRANAVLAGAPVAALWGPSPVTRASGRCLDIVRVLRMTKGAPAVEAVALRCQAVLETLRGRGEAARRMIASSRQLVEELGIMQRVLEVDTFEGMIELLEGDAVAAERCLRVAWEGLREQRLGIDAAQAGALLARAALAQGRIAEAEALSRESEMLAGDSFRAAIAWRAVRAEVLAARGEHATAVDFARAAVEIAAATDDLLDHADARWSLAIALRAAGCGPQAEAEERHAIDLWEAKGATVLAERARRIVSPIAQLARPFGVGAAPRLRPTRGARANAATAIATRLEAAVGARDVDEIARIYADLAEIVHHPTGVVIEDRDFSIARLHGLLSTNNPTFRFEPIATLGGSLALCRSSIAFDAYTKGDVDVGPVAREDLVLLEVDAQGQPRRSETFRAEQIVDAVMRLYRRYAESLGGPQRTRAEATARTFATLFDRLQKPIDVDRYAPVLAPELQFLDHRPLGFAATRGTDEFLRLFRSLAESVTDTHGRVHEILDLRPGALLVRRTSFGTLRDGGGDFERPFIHLWVCGGDGLLTHWENFGPEQTDEALARFDELTAEGSSVQRRVRANTATANVARLDAALAARDADSLPSLYRDDIELVDHRTGAIYGKNGALATMSSEDEILATLGESLALCRFRIASSGVVRDTLEWGAFETESIMLVEVDEHGLRRRVEAFRSDRLGDAIVRLYERYAGLLPEGPERTRAVATAPSVGGWLQGLGDADPSVRFAAAFAPGVEFVDHRALGFPAYRGIDILLRGHRAHHEVAREIVLRVDDILDLRPEAFLLRTAISGIDRASGGPYERPFLLLGLFDRAGHVRRLEWFDPERDADAIARFDALAAEPPEPLFTSVASRTMERFERHWRAHDWDGVVATFAPAHHVDDRRVPTLGCQSGGACLASLRPVFESGALSKLTLLATRGERLALYRVGLTGEPGDPGPFAREALWLVEVDGEGRRSALVLFDAEDLHGAYDELWERYLSGEGKPYAAFFSAMREMRRIMFERDWEALAKLIPEDFTSEDHRRFAGTGSRLDRAGWLRARGLMEDRQLRGDLRTDHVLRISPRAALCANTWFGTLDGGEFETPFLYVTSHDGERMHASDSFDLDQLDTALARYEELAREPTPPTHITNAATRCRDRVVEAWESRDWTRFEALVPSGLRNLDRRRQTGIDRDRFLATARRLREKFSSPPSKRVLATRGDRLALARMELSRTGTDELPEARRLEWLDVLEVDAHGEPALLVTFGPDDVDAAYAELNARYFAGEAAAHARVAEFILAFGRAFAVRDWQGLAELCTPDLVVHDHRLLGWEALQGVASWIPMMRSLVDLAPDVQLRSDHVETSEYGALFVTTLVGTHEGGPFEDQKIVVFDLDKTQRLRRKDQYDLSHLDAARARFAELKRQGAAPIEHGANR